MKESPLPFNLGAAFAGQEREWLAALETGRRVAGHHGVQGAGTELRWQELLEGILPHRYQVVSAFVVDSAGGQSEQIDLALVDRHYSPLFWEWGGHRYIPAESVYAVFEVKPTMNRRYLLYGADKVASVRRLHRTSTSFGWAQGTMPPREHFHILGGYLGADSDWTNAFGTPFSKALADSSKAGELDVGCILGQGTFERDPETKKVIVSRGPNTLVTFALTLLRRLQLLGSAPAIDYRAYAAWVSNQL